MTFKKKLASYVELPLPSLLQSPAYVYSESVLSELISAFEAEFKKHSFPIPVKWHYAMKANALPELLRFFKNHGAGLDLVSHGELREALDLKFQTKDLVFSGVGKKDSEIEAALLSDLQMINVESESEILRLAKIAKRLGKRARFSLRVNPDVDAKTHPYISTGMWEHKFGLDFEEARRIYLESSKSPDLLPMGMSMHIGSQIFETNVLHEALNKTLSLALDLKKSGLNLEILDVGGGLGVDYSRPEELPLFSSYVKFLHQAATQWSQEINANGSVVFECGRAFTAQAGFLVSEVIALKKSKKKNFLIVDASMTEILRPALYKAEHPVWTLLNKNSEKFERNLTWEVVGPVCESSDVLAKNIRLEQIAEGDVIALGCAGAYGAVMSQFYNSRPLPSEWWIDSNGSWKLCRPAVFRSYSV